jgi:4-amino-4-deoxy-L-arabinose transferase-like glycosyltransferase
MASRPFGIYTLFIVSFLTLSVVLQSDFAHISGFDEPIYMSSSNWPEKLALFDGHPPLGKWLYSFAQHGEETRHITHRAIALLFGTGVVLLISALISRITTNTYAVATSCVSLLAGQFLWVYSNTVSLEIFTAFLALCVVLLFLYDTRSSVRSRDISVGLCVGAAMLIKWSCATFGVAAMGIILFGQTSKTNQEKFSRMLRIIGSALACYTTLFIALSNVPWTRFFSAHYALYRFLQDTTGTFDFQSPMWMWPFGQRPITIFQSPEREILLCGCVWVHLIGLCAVIDTLRRWRSRTEGSQVLTIAFLATWLPWIVVPRDAKFIYYFFIPSIFLTVLAATWISEKKRWAQWTFAIGILCNAGWNVLTYLRVV